MDIINNGSGFKENGGYNRIDNELVCPCHAGVFNLQGNVLSGPAPRPLTQLALKITADKVTLG